MHRNQISAPFKSACTLVCFSLMAVSPALAERPSINQLNAAVNQLEAENNAQQAEIEELRAAILRAYDATGSEIGLLVDWEEPNESALVYLQGLGAYTRISTNSGLLEDGDNNALYFEGAGCTGQSYLTVEVKKAASRLVSPAIEGTERYFVGGIQHVGVLPMQSMVTFTARSLNSICETGPTSTPPDAVSAEEVLVGDLGLPLPLTLPIHIGPAP